MNKKFLSAILFGALMVTSTGTFVSCKDYDDDIEDLQTQINSNKDAIAALQKLVGEGNWVTGVTSIANGFTVTMSNGQTTTITGINGKDGVNGADGKNGTEWTIGEDGLWYMDGEKTAHQAVAKNGENGKPGATAPSPFINADGMWVVYELNAETGEFVQKVTEVSAQGTGAYVVKKDGVYVLHIADETGKFQDVTLPATSDSFVVEAPAAGVKVSFEYAKWKPQTAKDAYKALVAKYPEIAKVEENSLVKQGGNLPVLVTPAAVELTDKMSYELINMKGEVVDIKVANPVKGLPASASMSENGFIMTTRSTSNSGFWTLQAEPSLNEKGTAYVTTEAKAVSLAVTNEKGTTVNTPYAYIIGNESIEGDVDFDNADDDNDGKMTNSADYATAIDLFGLDEDGNSPIALKNEYLGYCFVELTEPADVERYGLSIDDKNVLSITKMPSDLTSIEVKVKVTALGLNGSAMSKDATITINQKISSDLPLADKSVVLTDAAHATNIRWNIADLKFNAVQLEKFVNVAKQENVKVALTREDKDGKYIAYYGSIKCYDAKGKEATDYKTASTFGFAVSGMTTAVGTDLTKTAYKEYTKEQILPENYTITLMAFEGDSQFFTSEATLKVSNPGAAAIKLVSEFVENNTLQAVGVVDPSKVIDPTEQYPNNARPIIYDLTKGIVVSSNVKIDKYVDVDYETYMASGSEDKEDMASQNWFESTETGYESELTVYAYSNTPEAKKNPAKYTRLEKTRNIRIEYHLFDNVKNTDVFEFPIVVKSAVYSAKPESVITMDGDALSAVFGGDDDTDLIKLADITTAVLAAGPDAGKSYDLFTVNGSETTKSYNNYAEPMTSAGSEVVYVVNSNSVPVQIEVNDMKAFNFNADQILEATGDKKFYLVNNLIDDVTSEDYKEVLTFSALWKQVKELEVYVPEKDEKNVPIENTYKLDNDKYKALESEEKAKVDLFKKYAGKAAFEQVKHTFPAVDQNVDFNLLKESSKVEFVDKATGSNFATISGSTIKAVLKEGVTVPSGKVEVPFKLTVKDAWGKTMVYQFKATFTTK